MSEESSPISGGNGGGSDNADFMGPPADQPPLMVQVQYIKDYSFEAPGAPGIFSQLGDGGPEISLECDVQANPMEPNVFEVLLNLKAECSIKGAVGFIQELTYGGVFTLNVPPEHLQAAVLIECPRMLFPFARAIMCSGSQEAGFPPMMIGHIDFGTMYQEQMTAIAESEESPAPKVS